MTAFESYTGTCNTGQDSEKDAQTFTPSVSHVIKSAKIYVERKHVSGAGTIGTITLGVYATSSGAPTGSALCTGTYDGSTLTVDTKTVIEISFGDGVLLTAGTTYALVETHAGGDTYNGLFIYLNMNANYSGGKYYYYTTAQGWMANGGLSEPTYTLDLYFIEYGEIPGGLFFCMG